MCNRYLVDEEVTGQDVMIGQLAHIVGWSSASGSPRGSHELLGHQRNEADNLMLLCYDQHKVIDDRSLWEVFDAATLRAMKRKHEARIRKLTAMGDDRATTVLRVFGGIHGQAVDLTEARVRTALLERDRFPDWTLRGVDDFEVDLRAIPGEVQGSSGYWAAARDHLQDRLEHLHTLVRKGHITHVSVFPLARIPVLVLLGTLLDDTLPTELYPKRRDEDEGWGWTADAPDLDFNVARIVEGSDRAKVAVLLSVSGTVDPARLPAEIDSRYSIYELTPAGVVGAPALITTPATLDAFSRAWRQILARIEVDHRGADSIAVFAAVPAVAAISMGRHLMRAAHPPLDIFDRVTGHDTYQFTVSTAPTIH